MEAVERQNPRQDTLVQSKRSYIREQKLHVLRSYTSNGSNLHRTCKKFDLNTKMVLQWIKNHKAMHDSKKGRKRVSFTRTAEYPEMDKALYEEYRGLCRCGLKVKGWWFRMRGQQLVKSFPSGSKFNFLTTGSMDFKTATKSVCAMLHKAQVVPSSKRELIRTFHRDIRTKAATGNQLGPLERFRLSCIVNVDQTPLPFTFTNGPTYEDKRSKTVWVKEELDKRKCTVQLTVFADGVPRVKPL